MTLPERSEDLSELQLNLDFVLALVVLEEHLGRPLDLRNVVDVHMIRAYLRLRGQGYDGDEASVTSERSADDLLL